MLIQEEFQKRGVRIRPFPHAKYLASGEKREMSGLMTIGSAVNRHILFTGQIQLGDVCADKLDVAMFRSVDFLVLVDKLLHKVYSSHVSCTACQLCCVTPERNTIKTMNNGAPNMRHYCRYCKKISLCEDKKKNRNLCWQRLLPDLPKQVAFFVKFCNQNVPAVKTEVPTS